jgi:DNA repair exonuclease SbcCD ATPase subunit
VARLVRRDGEPPEIDGEEKRLHAIRLAAEEELARLRRELSERVAAVERKERELADALTSVRRSPGGAVPPGAAEALSRAQIGLSVRAQELTKREAAVADRERALAKREKEFAERAAGDPEVQLAALEERLATLAAAEEAFARTRGELAARSELLSQREEDVAERERAVETATGTGHASPKVLEELEDRLHRLEVESHGESSERSFDDGLRRLERRGFHGPAA